MAQRNGGSSAEDDNGERHVHSSNGVAAVSSQTPLDRGGDDGGGGAVEASGRGGQQERRRDASNGRTSPVNLAGRGAGSAFNQHAALSPINTAGAASKASVAGPASASSVASTSSRHSHTPSSSTHTRGHPPPSLAPSSLGAGAAGAGLVSTSASRSHSSSSPREPHFPPNKSHSGSSTASASHAPRSPTNPSWPGASLPPGGPSSRPNSTSGHSSSSHGRVPSSDGHAAPGSERRSDRHAAGPTSSSARGPQTCAKCALPMTGQFVRALGTVYHLDCFRCQDCSKIVANKFFPIDAGDGSGRQVPLCETDYFRRLNLLCSKCGAALRGSYITALDMKFHVEHFTCSVCPTVFGPQDSYYEHAGSVYCHFHYSTRFAVKCTGCRTAILKQFVEINRNSQDEHWHPECYMIHKFWNIKLAPSPPVKAAIDPPATATPAAGTDIPSPPPPVPADSPLPAIESGPNSAGPPSRALAEAEYLQQEETETAQSLKARQKLMEEQVYRIWTVLSAFEESSAACISEMLRHVSSGQYIEGVRMAEKFVLHVETLFSAIDDLGAQFKAAGAKEISHVREARMLCKKVVNFFSLLSHTHEQGARKMSITQELLSLVTGLAHYLKILIRIALTAALKLEREYDNKLAIGHFLSKLDRLARDPEAHKIGGSAANAGALASSPTAIEGANGSHPASANGHTRSETRSLSPRTYGYKSLTRAIGSTLIGQGEATTDLCEACHLTVEEECARFGTSVRWHLACLKCGSCGKVASKDAPATAEEEREYVWLKEFRVDASGSPSANTSMNGRHKVGSWTTICSSCAADSARDGFDYVTRLEQYAFLLCVALNKLYALLKQRGVVPPSPDEGEGSADSDSRSLYDTYRDSNDIKRMKSVNLDRKISSSTARIPKRSTVVQSPSGRVAQPNSDESSIGLFSGKPPVPSRKDQPIVDPIRGTASARPPMPNMPVSQRSLPVEATQPLLAPSADHASSRPPLQRATTAVEIVDESVPEQSVTAAAEEASSSLGGPSEPTQDEDGITLADLPVALEAEQAREQQRYLSPRSGTLLSELSALEYLIVRHVAALILANESASFRDGGASLDELLEIIDARKGTFWNKLFKGNKKEKVDKKKGVFGIPLETLVERNGADSMHGAGPGSLRVPSFIDDVISAMKQMDMSVEGIFRKNGNIRRLKELSEALDRDSSSVNLSDDNPVQLAALLKKFLRDLPDPLLPFKVFSFFIATQRVENVEQRRKMLHLCCCLLPKSHRDTMEAIFVFLKWVASFSHVDEETGSKMDLLNLATVISPNILHNKSKDPAKDESFLSVRTVHELLEHQDEFWQVPAECVSILNDQELVSNPSLLTSKEILARAETHVRMHRRGPPPILHRGEVQPQRPDYNQAYAAPPQMPSGGRGPSSPLAPRPQNVRPLSYSTQAAPYPSGVPLHPAPRSPVGPPPGGFQQQQQLPRSNLGVQQSPQQQQQQQQQSHRHDGYHPPPPDDYRREGSA